LKGITEDGKELTRVCLIDFTSGIVVYDQLVKPTKPILDYLTRFVLHPSPPLLSNPRTVDNQPNPRRWSGITAEALAPITTTLVESALKSGKTPEEVGVGATGMGLRWTAADARNLEEAVELAKRGFVFLGVKQ
jgi:hypothetical protein